MGDSASDWSGQSLAEFCPGQRVVQRSVAGSTAAQWGSLGGGTAAGIGCSDFEGYPCIPKQAFATSDTPSDPVTHVWLQVGAVDWLTKSCYRVLNAAVREEMRQNVSRAISNVADAKPGIPIIMFSYLRPTMVPNECIIPVGSDASWVGAPSSFVPMPVNTMFETHVHMSTAIRDACEQHESKRCTYIDVENELGGSPNVLGTPCKYHRDGLHQNNRGYCKMFTQPKAQQAFGCAPQHPMPDCDTVNKTTPKAPRLYTGDAEHHEGWCKDYVPYYAPMVYKKGGPILLKPDQEPGGGGWEEPIASNKKNVTSTNLEETDPDSKTAFSDIDGDKDGYIMARDLPPALDQMNVLSDTSTNHLDAALKSLNLPLDPKTAVAVLLVDQFDENSDGRLNLAEFAALLSSLKGIDHSSITTEATSGVASTALQP